MADLEEVREPSSSGTKTGKRSSPRSKPQEKETGDKKKIKKDIDLSDVKNKIRRQELFRKIKHEKNEDKRKRRKKRKGDDMDGDEVLDIDQN